MTTVKQLKLRPAPKETMLRIRAATQKAHAEVLTRTYHDAVPIMTQEGKHYFASCAYGWAVGSTLGEVLCKLAGLVGTPAPMYTMIYLVDGHESIGYQINNYRPVGVESTLICAECMVLNK